MEGGSCNDYDYVCGDPVNGLDLSGLKEKKALPDLQAGCVDLTKGQDVAQSEDCARYREALITGDSEAYWGPRYLLYPEHATS